jgi:hypothetical protein
MFKKHHESKVAGGHPRRESQVWNCNSELGSMKEIKKQRNSDYLQRQPGGRPASESSRRVVGVNAIHATSALLRAKPNARMVPVRSCYSARDRYHVQQR